MNVLLALDGSPCTLHMLAWLAEHDDLLGDEPACTALTVVPAVPPRVSQFVERKSIDDYYASQANEVLAPVEDFARRAGWQLTARHRIGPAAERIVEMAESGDFDLIVIGSHGHSALGALTLGSVSTGVIARSRVPVLVVPRQRE